MPFANQDFFYAVKVGQMWVAKHDYRGDAMLSVNLTALILRAEQFPLKGCAETVASCCNGTVFTYKLVRVD